jgi:hypothetical protein
MSANAQVARGSRLVDELVPASHEVFREVLLAPIIEPASMLVSPWRLDAGRHRRQGSMAGAGVQPRNFGG